MTTDFLCEKQLAKRNPHYHALVKNAVFVLCHLLENYKTYFPDFTDHTILHSQQVLDFCNRLLGEQAYALNDDELFVLIMSAYLHDSGMGISGADYKALYDTVVNEDYRIAHPVDHVQETIRSFHQCFSRQMIYKYADLFEIPTPEHVQAIALVSAAHRRSNLFDESALPAVIRLENGNEIHLPFLAALIRLADELDIAADRNLGGDLDGHDTIFKMMHRSIRHLHILPDRFVLDVVQDDPALFGSIEKEVEKLRETMNTCVAVTAARTPFVLHQKAVEIRRIPATGKRITVIDTDCGTDDACALLLTKFLPKEADYIVASFGNTDLDGACRNAAILKKDLGLKAQIVRGLPAADDPSLPLAEKNTFHGEDGLANRTEELLKTLSVTQEELAAVLPFETFRQELMQADEITYITLGPLNNLAFLLQDKAFCRKISGIYTMGGGLTQFNCSHETEFNFSKSPKSVREILASGLNITLFTLDVTNKQLLSARQIDALEKFCLYPEFISFLRYNLQANIQYNDIPGAVLHDTLPILYLANPDWFKLKEVRLAADDYGHIYESGQGEALHICADMAESQLFEAMKSALMT